MSLTYRERLLPLKGFRIGVSSASRQFLFFFKFFFAVRREACFRVLTLFRERIPRRYIHRAGKSQDRVFLLFTAAVPFDLLSRVFISNFHTGTLRKRKPYFILFFSPNESHILRKKRLRSGCIRIPAHCRASDTLYIFFRPASLVGNHHAQTFEFSSPSPSLGLRSIRETGYTRYIAIGTVRRSEVLSQIFILARFHVSSLIYRRST